MKNPRIVKYYLGWRIHKFKSDSMKNYWFRLVTFLLLNFAALSIGSYFTNEGVASSWYESLSKAPWTPPGIVFGIAWTAIMICLGFYMANMTKVPDDHIYILYSIQLFLNILWNIVFFKFHLLDTGVFVITLLFVFVSNLMYLGFKRSVLNGILMLPYFIWLMIAISLNAYISVFN